MTTTELTNKRMAELATTEGERVRVCPGNVELIAKHTAFTTLVKTEHAVYVIAGSMHAVIERLAK